VATELKSAEMAALRAAAMEEPGALPPEVQPRNFREPRRLSRESLQRISKTIAATLQGVAQQLALPMRQFHKISVASVSEVNASGLFDIFQPPFVTLCFESQGHPGWLVWDARAAVSMTETILSGSLEEELEARVLSGSECRVVEQILMTIAVPIAEQFGFEITGQFVAQDPEELTTLEDAGPDADTQRLLIHLIFEGPGGVSDLLFYLPGVVPEEGEEAEKAPSVEETPEHLDAVPILAHAYLGSVDVPLTDLLAIEIGDVLPLDIEVGTPIQLYVEDRSCAQARWGQHNGNLALLVLEIDVHGNRIENPVVHPEDPTRSLQS